MKYKAFIQALEAAGIKYTLAFEGNARIVYIRAMAGPCNEGIGGLYSTWVFNSDGELEAAGTWEASNAA